MSEKRSAVKNPTKRLKKPLDKGLVQSKSSVLVKKPAGTPAAVKKQSHLTVSQAKQKSQVLTNKPETRQIVAARPIPAKKEQALNQGTRPLHSTDQDDEMEFSRDQVNGKPLGNLAFKTGDDSDEDLLIKKVVARKSRKNSRKQRARTPLPPPVEVSNYPKTKVKNLLVSQPEPVESEKNPYLLLAGKHHLSVTFRQFISVQGLSSQEFRAQRVDILEHGAVILTSKLAVDHFFRICNEMRITVPESMKYFCINEQTAYYLQKYIQYRKRKIFFGHGTLLDLVDVVKKNRTEKFLLPATDGQKEQIADFLIDLNIVFTKATFYKTVAADLSDIKSLAEFDILVFFTPVGIKSLKQNFPGFKQGNTRIAAFGRTTGLTVKSLGYRLDIFAPSIQNPSMSSALDAYIKEANKR